MHPRQPPFTIDATTAGPALASFQHQSELRLAEQPRRAAPFAARMNTMVSPRRSMAVPWRERPRDLTGSAISPAAPQRSLTPHCLCLSRVQRLSQADGAVCECARSLRGRRTRLCGSRSRAQGAPRCFARDCARLAALTARSRTSGRNYRRPRVTPLTTGGNGATLEFSSTVATRNPLHIDRCGAHESAAPGHVSFSFSIRFLAGDPCDNMSAGRAIRSGCAPASGQSVDPCRHCMIDIVTATRLPCVDTSGAALSAAHPHRKKHANRLDLQHGQAYHGRTTTTSAGEATRTSVARSRVCDQPE